MQDSKRDTDVQNRLLDSVGEGEGGMIWENGIETCIILLGTKRWALGPESCLPERDRICAHPAWPIM